MFKDREQKHFVKIPRTLRRGFVFGPATAVMFGPVNIQIEGLIVNQNNFIGIFMASLMIIILILILFGVHDFSRKN